MGVFDRTGSVRCTGCMYHTPQEYETSIKGFDGKNTLENYQDTHANA
jgi:hypothetical protein